MKKTVNILVALSFCFFCISCNQKSTPKEDSFTLVKSEKQLSFPIDDKTRPLIFTLFPFMDQGGKEYLTFQNSTRGKKDILFYDMNSGKLEFKIIPETEGPNGVGEIHGYYIHTLDSIYVCSPFEPKLFLIDRNARLLDKIDFEKADDGTTLSEYSISTSTYQPAVVIDNKMYIVPSCNRWVEKDPMSATIDLKTKAVHAYAYTYPTFPGADNKAKRYGVEGHLSRCFDGKQFVYSFYFDENIHVTSPDFESIYPVKVKSKYIDKVKLIDDYGNLTMKDMNENPNYGNLLYDPYRNVYYRIAYPSTEVENAKDRFNLELIQNGRKNFSIMILDKDFQVIGETLFPDYTYNSNLLFIRKDGLYISESHFMNPEFNEDLLCFRRLDLIEKE